MRQAGRYLPEYRELRKQAGSFLDLCFNPEFATEVTLQPLRRFDMDAAILFSDILVVPYALGQKLTFAEGEGPRLGALPDLQNLNPDVFDKKLSPVFETIRRLKKNLAEDKALIGFAGAPWTVACYMVEGRGGGEFVEAKKHAFTHPENFDTLIEKLTEVTARYLIEQVRHGADVVQIFDSWAGLLPAPYFERWVTAPTKEIVRRVRAACPDVPVIGFPRGAGAFYRDYAERTGVQGLGIDTFYPMEKAAGEIRGVTLQGNLDPVLLLTGGRAMEEATQRLLDETKNTPFIFNLGHGIIKETPPEHVARLSDIIKSRA